MTTTAMRFVATIVMSLCVTSWAAAQTSQPAGGGLIRRAGSSPSASSPSSPASTTQTSGASVRDAGGTFRTILSLAAILGLIVLMYWAGRRFLPRGSLNAGGSRAVQVLARTPVSVKHRVLLLQVGKRILVVSESSGTGGGSLSTLCEITEPDEVAALVGQVRADQSSASRSFASLLHNASGRFAGQSDPEPTSIPPADELAATQQQLDGLTQRVRVMARQFERA